MNRTRVAVEPSVLDEDSSLCTVAVTNQHLSMLNELFLPAQPIIPKKISRQHALHCLKQGWETFQQFWSQVHHDMACEMMIEGLSIINLVAV